jgi:hypothetical protein
VTQEKVSFNFLVNLLMFLLQIAFSAQVACFKNDQDFACCARCLRTIIRCPDMGRARLLAARYWQQP